MEYYRKIVGVRLYLSPFRPDDETSIATWVKWMNDSSVAENYGGLHNMVSPSNARQVLAELNGYRFDIVLQNSDELIGHISVHDVDFVNRNAYVGIFIGDAQHRNKGYGTEALRLVLHFGFKVLNLHSIALTVHEDNEIGIACYKKAGFREWGRRREALFKNGRYVAKLYMDILANDFDG